MTIVFPFILKLLNQKVAKSGSNLTFPFKNLIWKSVPPIFTTNT